jgi:hypothetical protein
MTSPTDPEFFSQVDLIEGDVPVLEFFSRALPPLEHNYILSTHSIPACHWETS